MAIKDKICHALSILFLIAVILLFMHSIGKAVYSHAGYEYGLELSEKQIEECFEDNMISIQYNNFTIYHINNSECKITR